MTDATDINSLISSHMAINGKPLLIGQHGYSIPCLHRRTDIVVCDATLPLLASLGITINGGYGKNNVFSLDSDMAPIQLSVSLNNRDNARFFIEDGSRLIGNISIEGNGHLFTCCKSGNNSIGLRAVMRQHQAAIVIGKGITSSHVTMWVEGPKTALVLGDDGMLAWGIWLRCADSHRIIDLEERRVINPPGDIIIGPHCWLGQDALIMKDVVIGAGSIIGARSIVTKTIPKCSLVAGSPGRVLRSNVSWTRRSEPTEAEIAEIAEAQYLLDQ